MKFELMDAQKALFAVCFMCEQLGVSRSGSYAWKKRPESERRRSDRVLAEVVSGQPPRGLLHHSDRGSQYASVDYRQALAARGIEYSMSRKGNCWDNAVVESFFSTLKQELVYTTDFTTHEQARLALFEYIEVFYNWQRRHSTLGYVSPVQFELAALSQKLAGIALLST